jgi:translation initiation factor IF-3
LDTKNPKINNQITAPVVRVINEQGENLGVLSKDEALKMAKDQGLDMIEIVSTVTPPIVKIISFDKYRYQKEKAAKKERVAAKLGTATLKQIQISPRAAINDLQTKIKQLEKFLEGGHQIEVQLRLRGREKANKDWAMKKLDEFVKMITIEHKIASSPKFGGRGIQVQIVKKK